MSSVTEKGLLVKALAWECQELEVYRPDISEFLESDHQLYISLEAGHIIVEGL